MEFVQKPERFSTILLNVFKAICLKSLRPFQNNIVGENKSTKIYAPVGSDRVMCPSCVDKCRFINNPTIFRQINRVYRKN